MSESINLTDEHIQPQSNSAMYPTIHIDLDTTLEWRKLTGDKSDKYDQMKIINDKIMNNVKQQILDNQEKAKMIDGVKIYIENNSTLQNNNHYVNISELKEILNIE